VQMPPLVRLFPLPNVVFFPKTVLPLHIFEPRYREMVSDALQGDGLIGMTLLKEGWEQNYNGSPPIHRVGCLGRICKSERMNDGRYNIILYGIAPFEIRDETLERSFRHAWVLYPDREESGSLPPPLRSKLERALTSHGQRLQIPESFHAIMSRATDEEWVQTLSFLGSFTIVEKQFLLESTNVVQQCRRLLDLICFYSAMAPKKEDHA